VQAAMRVISKSRLKQFWESPGRRDAMGPLLAWYQRVNNRSTDWQHWGEVKRDYASASAVGNCIVFNIAGNKYRLVTRVLYPSHKVFVLRVMTHAEYDNDSWKTNCGCLAPSPQTTKRAGRKAR
jgi:mRNA interferase HigB